MKNFLKPFSKIPIDNAFTVHGLNPTTIFVKKFEPYWVICIYCNNKEFEVGRYRSFNPDVNCIEL